MSSGGYPYMNICVHLCHLRLETLDFGLRQKGQQTSSRFAFRVFSVFRGSQLFAPFAPFV